MLPAPEVSSWLHHKAPWFLHFLHPPLHPSSLLDGLPWILLIPKQSNGDADWGIGPDLSPRPVSFYHGTLHFPHWKWTFLPLDCGSAPWLALASETVTIEAKTGNAFAQRGLISRPALFCEGSSPWVATVPSGGAQNENRWADLSPTCNEEPGPAGPTAWSRLPIEASWHQPALNWHSRENKYRNFQTIRHT